MIDASRTEPGAAGTKGVDQMAGSRKWRMEHHHRLELYAALGALVAVIAIFAGHFWPPSHSSLDAVYQHTWNGQISLPERNSDSVDLSLALGAGGINQVVGSISSPTFGCADAVVLENGNGPVTLKLVASNSALTCQLLSFFNTASITLIGGDELQFSVTIFGMSVSCDLYD
jgi:hypothetical protein